MLREKLVLVPLVHHKSHVDRPGIWFFPYQSRNITTIQFWKLMSRLVVVAYIILLIHFEKFWWKLRHPSQGFMLHFLNMFFLLQSVRIYCTWCIAKYTGNILCYLLFIMYIEIRVVCMQTKPYSATDGGHHHDMAGLFRFLRFHHWLWSPRWYGWTTTFPPLVVVTKNDTCLVATFSPL